MKLSFVQSVVFSVALLFATAPTLTGAFDAEQNKNAGTLYKINVLNDFEFEIGGKTYPMEQLAKRLKSSGAKANSEIRVQIPQETAIPTLKKFTTTLTAAGYTKLVFVKPRHAEAIPGK